MKPEKYDALTEEVLEWIAEWHMKSHHVFFFEHIVQAFPDVKKKHLKKIYKDLTE